MKEAGDRSDSLLTINQPPRHGLVMALVVIVAPIDNVVPGTKAQENPSINWTCWSRFQLGGRCHGGSTRFKADAPDQR